MIYFALLPEKILLLSVEDYEIRVTEKEDCILVTPYFPVGAPAYPVIVTMRGVKDVYHAAREASIGFLRHTTWVGHLFKFVLIDEKGEELFRFTDGAALELSDDRVVIAANTIEDMLLTKGSLRDEGRQIIITGGISK